MQQLQKKRKIRNVFQGSGKELALACIEGINGRRGPVCREQFFLEAACGHLQGESIVRLEVHGFGGTQE